MKLIQPVQLKLSISKIFSIFQEIPDYSFFLQENITRFNR